MNTVFEEKKLINLLGENVAELLKKYNAFIAGGTITSLFTNSEINDFDIYLRNEEDAIGLIEEFWDSGIHIISSTNKATQFMQDEKLFQIIHFNYFEDVSVIFETFDFTACMGAYDFKESKFHFDEDFLKHNSQKLLRFNSGTKYPIVSALRVQKYENKGYKISKAEYLRVVMTCMNLDINTYEELMEHLGGLYGVNLDKVFEEIKDEEFDLQKAIDILMDITYTDEYFKEPIKPEFEDLDDILCKISPKAIKYLEFKDNTYRVHNNGEIASVCKKKEPHTMVDIKDVLPDNKLYKFVHKNSDGEYVSFHDKSFKYVIGEIAEAKGNVGNGYCDSGKLHFNIKEKIKKSTYYREQNKVLLEVIVNHDDLIDIDKHDKITARKVYVLREVADEEWKQWVGEDVNNDKSVKVKLTPKAPFRFNF